MLGRHRALRPSRTLSRSTQTTTSTLPVAIRLNRCLADYPTASFSAYTATSLGTFGAAYLVLDGLQFVAPSLAVAAVVGKLTKKFRAPVDLSLAAALSHAVPATNGLKLGPLLAAPLTGATTTPDRTTLTGQLEAGAIGLVQWAEGPVNKYGAPYMLVHWASGLTLVGSTTWLVHQGFDVMTAAAHLPLIGPFLAVDPAAAAYVSGQASCLAGAMLINTLSMPLRLYFMSLYARDAFVWWEGHAQPTLRRLNESRTRHVRSLMRSYLRDHPDKRRLVMRSGRDRSP